MDKRYNSPLIYKQAQAIRILKSTRKAAERWRKKCGEEIEIVEAQDTNDTNEGKMMQYARLNGIADWIELELLLSNKKKED